MRKRQVVKSSTQKSTTTPLKCQVVKRYGKDVGGVCGKKCAVGKTMCTMHCGIAKLEEQNYLMWLEFESDVEFD